MSLKDDHDILHFSNDKKCEILAHAFSLSFSTPSSTLFPINTIDNIATISDIDVSPKKLENIL